MATICSRCGHDNMENTGACAGCGLELKLVSVATAPVVPPPLPMPQPIAPGFRFGDYHGIPPDYAGFWLRLAAHLIDGCIISIPFSLFYAVFISMMLANSGKSADAIAGLVLIYAAIFLPLSGVMVWLYYALMESSATQGTLGKMALGLKVTDIEGNRLTFAQASGRTFAKILSQLILGIGFLMAGFTEKKQALHDMIVGCLVVKK